MSSAVLRNEVSVASSQLSAGTASMASAIAAGSVAVCINPAAMPICSSNSVVMLAATPGGASLRASRSRRGMDRKVTARSLGEELLIGTSWHLTAPVSTHARRRRFGGDKLVPMFDGKFRVPIDRAVKPIGNVLRKTRLTPDHLTIVGLVVAGGAAVAIGFGQLRLGLLLVVMAALPDLFDGALAKASNSSSQRGAYFDSVVDRVTDATLLGGVAWYVAAHDSPRMSVLPFAVMALGSVISYQRAKAESLGLNAKGGLMERAERIIALCLGLLFDFLLIPMLWVMLVLSAITALQRFVKVWKQAAVAPVTAARIEMRRSRRQTRRVVRTARRHTRISRPGRHP